jgi:Zn-finger domain-containing protein
MDNVVIDLEEIYGEIKERAFEAGAYSREEFNDLVEEILEEKREVQEMHDDVDWEEMKEALRARYSDFEIEIPEA